MFKIYKEAEPQISNKFSSIKTTDRANSFSSNVDLFMPISMTEILGPARVLSSLGSSKPS